MKEPIFCSLSKLVLDNSQIVEEAIETFRKDVRKIYDAIDEELRAARIEIHGYKEGKSIITQPTESYRIEIDNKEIDILFDVETLKQMRSEIGIWTEKEKKWEKKKDISIENKTPEQIGKEAIEIVKTLKNELKKQKA